MFLVQNLIWFWPMPWSGVCVARMREDVPETLKLECKQALSVLSLVCH